MEALESAPRKPPRLRPGMTLGLISPSSPVLERSTVNRGAAELENLGFRLVFGAHARDTRGYLAGHDADRADDLLTMLERDDVDAVVCVSGGYGAMRTVCALDRDRLTRLKERPAKAVVGYSDVTVVHAMIARELGWVTFYGPMVSTFARATDYTVAAFRRALMETAPFDILPDPDDPYVETLVPGVAEGELAGGCLTLLASLVGTPWEPDLRGKIVFFEDVHCAPYEVDRLLAQLIAAGRLDHCAGLIIGEHADCAPKNPGATLGLEQVFDDLIRPLGIPTLYHLPIGHGRHLATLPLGVRAQLDAGGKRLRIRESGVV